MSKDNKDSIFDQLENKTNVRKEDLMKLAKSVSSKDLNDEKNLKKLIKDVARLAGKDISKEKEDKILNAIKKDKIPKDLKNIL